MKKINILFIIFFPFIVFGQNQNPSNIDFKKIQTENFEIIFPEDISSKAEEAANLLENFYIPNTNKLKSYPKPISLMLFNQSVVSNAYAGIAPRRMGWYTTPIQNSSLGITDWFTTLSLHEYAHVIQYNKNKQYFTLLASFFLGDIGQAMMQYAIPDWFFEGDAIYSETVFSNSGRGRVSNFALPIRTILLTDQKFNYSQAVLKSYRRFYPNHYYLGYYMVSHVNRNFGVDVWDKILTRSSIFSFWPFSFSNSLKKYTGYNQRQTYKNAMNELDYLWTKQIENLEITEAQIINKEKKKWETYFVADFKDNETIIGLKYSFSFNNTLFEIDFEGNENIIKEVDASTISVSGERIVWARENPDIRWGEQSFSDIVVYNINTKELKEITKEGKYFSPEINNAGNQIVAVEYTPQMKCSLVILDSETGEIISKIESPNNDLIKIPSWSEDDSKIVFCNSSKEGQALTIYDIDKKIFTEIIPYSWENFSRPIFHNNYIIYNSEYSGIGNIYAIDIETKQKYQITSRKFGAYNPKVSPDKTKLIFQDYTEKGYDIAMIELNPETWKKIEDIEIYKLEYFTTEEKKDEIKSLINNKIYNTNEYEVSDYKEFKHLINIHSWFPMISEERTLGLEVYSNNLLNTLSLTGGVNHNLISNSSNAYTTASYQKFFPIFDLSLKVGEEYQIYDSHNIFTETKTLDSVDVWKETNIGFGTWVPLNFSKGIYYRDLSFGTSVFYKNINGKETNYLSNSDLLTNLSDGQFGYLSCFVNVSNVKQLAYRDVRSRMAQTLNLSYRFSLFSKKWDANQFYVESNFYFPGMFKSHSLKMNFGYEKQVKYNFESEINQYYFPSKMNGIRGRVFGLFDKKAKATIDYELPILYPDLAIGPFIYFKRVKLLAFYDYQAVGLNDNVFNYKSTGAQLLFDVSFFRYNYEVEIGIQGAYLMPEKTIDWGLIFLGIEI